MQSFLHPISTFLLNPETGIVGTFAFFFVIAAVILFANKFTGFFTESKRTHHIVKVLFLVLLTGLYVTFENQVSHSLTLGKINQFYLLDPVKLVPNNGGYLAKMIPQLPTFWQSYGWVILIGFGLTYLFSTIRRIATVAHLLLGLLGCVCLCWIFFQNGYFTAYSVTFLRAGYFVLAALIASKIYTKHKTTVE